MNDEMTIKEERLRKLLVSRKLDAVIFAKQTNFLWFTCGHSNRIILNEDISLVYLVATLENKYLIATSSDSERVMNEELEGLGFELVTYHWYNQTFMDAIRKLNIKGQIGSDFTSDEFINIDSEIAHLRIELTDYEQFKIKSLSESYSVLLTDFCSNLHPGLREREIAGMLYSKCMSLGIFPVVIMVGSDERIFHYRHPVVTDKPVEHYVLLATVVEQYGLNISISRSVYFGKVPREIQVKKSAVNFIEANYYAHSLPGTQLGELLEIGKKAYKEVGYPEEWKKHTQGGIVGYKPREFLVTEDCDLKLKENNILGWNPTLPGVKAEDIIIVKKGGVEQLSIDSNWPSEKIQIDDKTFIKPMILEVI